MNPQTPEARSPEEYILLAALLHVFVALKRTWDISMNYSAARLVAEAFWVLVEELSFCYKKERALFT